MKETYEEYIKQTIIETIKGLKDEEKLKYYYAVIMSSYSEEHSETDHA